MPFTIPGSSPTCPTPPRPTSPHGTHFSGLLGLGFNGHSQQPFPKETGVLSHAAPWAPAQTTTQGETSASTPGTRENVARSGPSMQVEPGAGPHTEPPKAELGGHRAQTQHCLRAETHQYHGHPVLEAHQVTRPDVHTLDVSQGRGLGPTLGQKSTRS